MNTELHLLSAGELSQAYATGALSPLEAADAVLDRISAAEPRLNVFSRHDPDAVRGAARESEARWRDGTPLSPLDGVPVTVKENIARAGVPMSAGTALPDPPVATRNAPITDRLLEAGLVILGSTVMPDKGMLSSGVSSLHGITPSAWHPDWNAGGSSSGAATAAAGGYGPLHVGSDIGGSIRLPCGWQGLTGLKPSAGMIPLDPPYVGRTAGPMCRRLEDLALLMVLLARPDARDFTAGFYPRQDWEASWEPAGKRIGLQLDAGSGVAAEPEVRRAVERAASRFADAGAEIVEVSGFLPPEILAGIDRFWRIRFLSDLRPRPREQWELVLPYLLRWCLAAEQLDAVAGIEAYHCLGEAARLARAATDGLDLTLSPVAPMPTFPADLPMPHNDPDKVMTHISFTVPYNMSGQPAGSINCGRTPDGRWIGLQLAGPFGRDDQVLAAMRWFAAYAPADAAVDWSELDRRP